MSLRTRLWEIILIGLIDKGQFTHLSTIQDIRLWNKAILVSRLNHEGHRISLRSSYERINLHIFILYCKNGNYRRATNGSWLLNKTLTLKWPHLKNGKYSESCKIMNSVCRQLEHVRTLIMSRARSSTSLFLDMLLSIIEMRQSFGLLILEIIRAQIVDISLRLFT